MERAFNFADNQVLERYGFTHAALGSFKTQKIRKDSADPLGVVQQQDESSAEQTVKSDASTLKEELDQVDTEEAMSQLDIIQEPLKLNEMDLPE